MVGSTDASPKIVLVVGGAGGIGMATAVAFRQMGYAVFIADLGPAVEKCAMDPTCGDIEGVTVDVGSRESIEAMYAAIRGKVGRLDILVNCAGIIYPSPSDSADEVVWDRLIDIDLTGTFRCIQGALPLLKKSSFAVIVNVSSVLSRRGVPGRASYTAAKAGVEALTRVLAVEWADAGIRVNCVAPGYTRTEMNAEAVRLGKLDDMELMKKIPMGRLAKPDEIASGIAFLASSEASYVTGQTLVIDGGLTVSGQWWSGD